MGDIYIVDKDYDNNDNGTLRSASLSGAEYIIFNTPTVNLQNPLEFSNFHPNLKIYGYTNTIIPTINNYGFVFNNGQNVDVQNLIFNETFDDSIRFNNIVNGSVSHCTFQNHIDTSDESISAIKGCGRINISFCQFINIKKAILLGTGMDGDEIQDNETYYSIFNNIFDESCERRYPYGTGKIAFSGNWIRGWKYHGVQSFAFRLRYDGKAIITNNIFEQRNSFWNGFPKNWFCRGGAFLAITLENNAEIYQNNNIFDKWWLFKSKNTHYEDLFSSSELSSFVVWNGELSTLKDYLLDKVGPKPITLLK